MNTKIIIIIIIAIVVIAGALYFVSSGRSDSGSTIVNAPTTTLATSSVVKASQANTLPVASKLVASKSNVVIINIRNFAFSPSDLVLKVGAKVTWINNDSAPHTVTSDSSNLLDSPTLSPGQSFSFTFANPGSFPYHCSIHPTMKGNVVVN